VADIDERLLARGRALGQVVVHVKVEVAVAIEVKETNALPPGVVVDACGGSNVGECAVAIVVIQNAWPVAGNKQIKVAVVVVVARGAPLAVARSGDAGLLSDVSKFPVAAAAIDVIRDHACT